MAEQFITCPSCGSRIQLTEALTQQIAGELQRSYDQRLERELAQAKTALAGEYQQKAQAAVDLKLKDLQAQLSEKSGQLQTAQQQQLELLKRQRQLEEKERSLKLELEQQLTDERSRIWQDATTKLAEEQRLKDRQKDEQLKALQQQIEELKRRAEQSSQQAQGEALELELEELLKANFPHDSIEEVAKGVRGADVIQRVHDPAGQLCGSIIWESKRTKNWSKDWLAKLKDDQRAAKADIAVIVSTVLPKEADCICQAEGVWVTDFASAMGLALALRANLVGLAQARSAQVGKNEKMEVIYDYLAGPEFKQRVEAIVEAFGALKSDLEAERRAMERIWAKREKQLSRVIGGTAGMYGDLQGIIGASLPAIQALELPGEVDDESGSLVLELE